MANELVRLNNLVREDESRNGRRDDFAAPNAMGHGADAAEEWDLPPEQMGYGRRAGAHPQPEHGPHVQRAARRADDDAARARARGDDEFATIRESDAADLRQSALDWGDLKTWLWIGGMCIVFLLMVALCYYLPYGRHASPPPIRIY